MFQSQGRVTPDGLRRRGAHSVQEPALPVGDVQAWGLNVVRQVQHSGHEDSWAPARRAGLSFLGAVRGARGADRPPARPRGGRESRGHAAHGGAAAGAAGRPGAHWQYDRPSARQLGGNARWGITNNLTLNGTVNPDFSQIESDAGQLIFDPRQALFFAEKRPFFLDGIEQFATPHSLIYTRRIVQPDGGGEADGEDGGHQRRLPQRRGRRDRLGVANRISRSFNLLRVQRDIGTSSKFGVAYTDRVDGGRLQSRGGRGRHATCSVASTACRAQYAQSFTRQADGKRLERAALARRREPQRARTSR